MRGVLCALVLALAASQAAAQEETAGTHYQAYREAIARGDLSAAEREAGAALAASEQSDGDGGRTAVLAFNLASVRAHLGQWEAAAAPARRAYELSRSNRASGVDATMAELMWGRVRLSLEGFQGASFLTHALERAASRSDLLADRYDAAEQLGTWAMQGHSYIVARSAWRLAADAARGAQYDAEFARGRALAYEGMAIALQSMSRDIFMTPTDAREARDVFAEAHRIMRPFAVLGSSDAGVTAPQRAYAEILAWDSVVRAKMVGDDASRREAEAALEANPTVVDGAPACTIRRRESNGDDGLAYPDRAGREGQIGAVVMRMRFDASGAYQDAVLAASVGHEDLERSVVAAAGNWTYITDVNADCRVQRVVFMPVTFWMRQW